MQGKEVANPGSALGEAIGSLIEENLHRILKPIAEQAGCVYITTGPINIKTQKPTKLLLTDAEENKFNVDSVIATIEDDKYKTCGGPECTFTEIS